MLKVLSGNVMRFTVADSDRLVYVDQIDCSRVRNTFSTEVFIKRINIPFSVHWDLYTDYSYTGQRRNQL